MAGAGLVQVSHFCYIADMRWTVEILSAQVAAEIAALPPDMYARLARLIGIIEEYGFPALPRDSVKHLDSKAMGVARDGPGRDIACNLCDRERSTGRDFAGIREENSEDAAART